MSGNDIVGSWKSFMTTGISGIAEPYDRQTLEFYSSGRGHMHAKTLFGRNRSFTWEYVPYGEFGEDYYTIRDLGGPGAIAHASIEEAGTVLAVLEGTMMTGYRKQ